MNDWRYNHNHYLPQDNDNIIIAENNHRVNFVQNININDINLYGFNGVFTVIEDNPTTRVIVLTI